MTGFPKWGRLVGDNLGKMAENCMEIRKSMFWGQNSVRDMGDKTVFQVVGGGSRPESLTRGNYSFSHPAWYNPRIFIGFSQSNLICEFFCKVGDLCTICKTESPMPRPNNSLIKSSCKRTVLCNITFSLG